jgi:hypothetical protein
MAAYGQVPDPRQAMAAVRPRTGFPVRNMGGMPQQPTPTPPRPFVPGPTVAAGPPGPTPTGRIGTGGFTGRPGAPMPSLLDASTPPGGGGAGPAPGVPGVPGIPPAPAPGGAPAPAPAPAPGTSTSTSTSSGSSTQSPVVSPGTAWNLENQLNDYLKGAFGGSVSPEFIQRAKGDVFRNVSGQTAQARNRLRDQLAGRGMLGGGASGAYAGGLADIETGGLSSMSRGLADILNSAEQQNIQGRQSAAGTATNLLGMNREESRYQQQRADAAAARAAAGAPQTFTYIDPDTGQSYELDESWF